MRIAQLIRPAAGGMRRHFVFLLKELSKNYQVKAYIPGDDYLAQDLRKAGVDYEIIPFPARGTPWDYYRLGLLLARKWKDENFSLFHFHGYKAAVAGSLALKKLKKGKAVATIHNFPPPGFLNKIFFWFSRKIIASSCQILIFVSQAVKDSWKASESLHSIVIYNGVSEDFFKSGASRTSTEDPEKGKLKVAYLGRFSREKGPDIFLRAAYFLKDEPKLEFLVAGQGESKEKLLELAFKLGLKDKIRFLDFQPNLQAFFKTLDIVVIPSRQEAFSLLAIEALAFGKPVVASRVGGLPEALGPFGYFFPPEDSKALAQKIKEAVENLSAFPAEKARQWVQRKFPLSKMISQIEEVYRKVAEGSV